MLSAIFYHCHGMHFLLFVNYQNFGDKRMIATSICAIKEQWNLPDFFNSSPICPHNFSFHTLSLYFLCDMSYNSSHLRTNSINFSSISDDNQECLIANKHLKHSGDVITAHMIRIKYVGPMPSRQTFSLGGGEGTELRRDRDVPVSVNISVSLHMRKVY